MAYQNNGTGLLLMIVISMLWVGAMGQSSSCTNVLISMSPCLNYITGNSSSPSSSCCTQLASVVRLQPQCLCEVLNSGGSSLGLNINQTQAAALPATCRVQTPPVSQCNAAAPNNSPSGTPRSPNVSSGRESPPLNMVPSTDSGSSDAGSTKLAATLLFFFLFASSALTSTMFC